MLYKTAVLNVYDFHGGLTFISTARTHSMPPLLCGDLMTRLLLTPVCGPITQCSNELNLQRYALGNLTYMRATVVQLTFHSCLNEGRKERKLKYRTLLKVLCVYFSGSGGGGVTPWMTVRSTPG